MRTGSLALFLVACSAYEAPSGTYRVEALTLDVDTCGLVDRLPGGDDDLAEVRVEWFGLEGGLRLDLGTISLPCGIVGQQFECLPSVTEDAATTSSNHVLHETLWVRGTFKRGSDALSLTYATTVTCSGTECATYAASNGYDLPCEIAYDAVAMPQP